MLDGRIDTQGFVTELRAQGVLDDIAHDEAIEVHKEEQAVAEAEAAEKGDEDPDAEDEEDLKFFCGKISSCCISPKSAGP